MLHKFLKGASLSYSLKQPRQSPWISPLANKWPPLVFYLLKHGVIYLQVAYTNIT